MIIDERLLTYLNSLGGENSPVLDEIEREALEAGVPVVRKDMQHLLRFLLAAHRPERILEVGCAVGFSAILMAENAKEGCRISTIENWPPRIKAARENIRRAGREGQIELLEGDAGEILPRLRAAGRNYDWIFMDAAKGQYMAFLPDAIDLLESGGLLISDNVLLDGMVLESRYAIERRDRTTHRRMREYLYAMTHNDALATAVLPVGDGVSVSVKLPLPAGGDCRGICRPFPGKAEE